MSKVSVFVDITDLYYKLLKVFKKGKLDYSKYLESIKTVTGSEIIMSVAYGCQNDSEATSFIGYLRSLGFVTRYKRPYVLKVGDRNIKRCNWLVGLSVDVIRSVVDSGVDKVVLCTSNPDILPLVKYLEEELKVEVTIYACLIAPNLARVASHTIEISEELLEDEINKID